MTTSAQSIRTDKTYIPTGAVEVLLESLRKHAEADQYDSLAKEEKSLAGYRAEMDVAKKQYEYKQHTVAESQEKIIKLRRKIAEIITALGRLGCPEELMKRQWLDYNKKPKLVWPSGHEIAEWIKYPEG